MRTAAATGGVGDILYYVPTLQRLKVTKLYIKENFYYPPFGSMYTTCKRLVELQGIKCFPTTGGDQFPFHVYEKGLKFDYDMDMWRMQPNRGRDPIQFSIMNHFRTFHHNWKDPWLKGVDISDEGYNLIFLTERWRDNSTVDWNGIRLRLDQMKSPYYFIGHPEDHERFEAAYGKIEWMQTIDLLDLAKVICASSGLYCNQGVALVIAQGFGKNYWCAFKPGKTNCMRKTRNEHFL